MRPRISKGSAGRSILAIPDRSEASGPVPSAVRSRLARAGGSPIVPVAWIVAPFTPASTAAIASPSALRRNCPLTLNAPLGSRSRVSADSSERSDPVAAIFSSVPTQRGSSPSVPPTVSDVPPTRTFSSSKKSRRASRRRRPARSNGRAGSPTTPVHAPTTAAFGPAASTSAVNRSGRSSSFRVPRADAVTPPKTPLRSTPTASPFGASRPSARNAPVSGDFKPRTASATTMSGPSTFRSTSGPPSVIGSWMRPRSERADWPM